MRKTIVVGIIAVTMVNTMPAYASSLPLTLAGFPVETEIKQPGTEQQYVPVPDERMTEGKDGEMYTYDEMYNRPLLKENELLPDGNIIGHEDDVLAVKDQMTEQELYEYTVALYGQECADFFLGTDTAYAAEPETAVKTMEPLETEQQTEPQTDPVQETEIVTEAPETEEPQPETPYYVEEHLEEGADQRYIEESPLWLLAHIGNSEAGNCDFDEMVKVISVVMNRVHHPAFPNTIVEVLYADNPLQYAPTLTPDRFYAEPCETAWEAAQWVLDNGSIFPEDVVYQATFPQGSAVYEYSPWGQYFCYY